MITEKIFNEHKRWSQFSNNTWSWGEVQELLKKRKVELLPTDTLQIGFDEGYQDGDASQDPHYYITVHRDRPETDKEFEKRKEEFEAFKKSSEEKRREQYLKLKEEFENEVEEGT